MTEYENYKTDDSDGKVILLDYKTDLSELYLPDGINILTEGSFHAETKNIVQVIDLSNSITSIQPKAFADMKVLSQVRLSTQLEEICDEAFSGCTSLSKIRFPYSLKKIGKKAFANTAIAVCVLPDSVEIAEDSFPENCKINRIDEYGSEWF